MPDASPQPPKLKTRADSAATKTPEFIGRLAAALDRDNSTDPSTINAPPRNAAALPRITTTAEIVMPTERGNGHPFSIKLA